jgi:hypothetical protein
LPKENCSKILKFKGLYTKFLKRGERQSKSQGVGEKLRKSEKNLEKTRESRRFLRKNAKKDVVFWKFAQLPAHLVVSR